MATAVKKRVPPLATGDRLDRREFLRRWEADPEIKNAELIGGTVFISSPVSPEHGDMGGQVGAWLGTYGAYTPGTVSGHNTTSRYQCLKADTDCIVRSRVFPGLWLDSDALLKGELKRVLKTLEKGLQSPEHEKFVVKLMARKTAKPKRRTRK